MTRGHFKKNNDLVSLFFGVRIISRGIVLLCMGSYNIMTGDSYIVKL